MRTISTGQDAVLRSAAMSVFQRMRVENGSGTLVNLTTYGGRDWFNGAEMSANVDEIVPAAHFYVARSHSTAASGSLAPLIAASTLNVNDSGSYAALLDPGADVYWDVATLAQGSTLPGVASTNWTNIFAGTIDSVGFGGPEIDVYARDKIGAVLADRWVEDEQPYGTESGTAIETVMQDIADDWADSQTVTTPSSPGFLVTTYQQVQQSVLDAHRALAQLIGWDARPQWHNTSSAFAYVLSEPDRAPSTYAFTFGSSGYYDVKRLDITRENVRNAIVVRYTSTSGVRGSYEATSTASIARFGRRWMEIDLPDDSDVNSTGEAADLGDSALADLSVPDAEQEIENSFFWPVQLGDYYHWLPNGVHYDVAQDWAIYGYRHVVRPGECRTYMQVRGKPAGQYANWLARGRTTRTDNQQTNAKSLLNFRDTQDSTANTVTFTWTRGDLVYEVWIYDAVHAQPESSDPWPGLSDIPTSVLSIGTDTYVATIPDERTTRTIQFEPRTSINEAGQVRRVRLYPRNLSSVASSSDIADGVVVASALVASAQKFGSDIVWSATDNDTVAWSSGTIAFASSTSYGIGAGNTGNMASTALRYVYLDSAISSTALQVTTTLTDTVGDGRTLLAVVAKAPSTGQLAFFVPAVGILGLNGDSIGANSITTTKITDDAITTPKLVANSVTAAKIAALTITANEIAANTITSAKLSVSQLSAISADLGTVTAGTVSAAVIVASCSFTAATARFTGQVDAAGYVSALNGAAQFTPFVGGSWSGYGVWLASSSATTGYSIVSDLTNGSLRFLRSGSTAAAASVYEFICATKAVSLTDGSTAGSTGAFLTVKLDGTSYFVKLTTAN